MQKNMVVVPSEQIGAKAHSKRRMSICTGPDFLRLLKAGNPGPTLILCFITDNLKVGTLPRLLMNLFLYTKVEITTLLAL